MADLNIRNVPPETLRRLKADAALNGMTLREWCLRLLNGVADPPTARQTVETRRSSHDPKTCRNYHCLMCKVAKT